MITAYAFKAAAVFQLNIFQLGSSDCIRHLHYFEELVVVTVFPFCLSLASCTIYALVLTIRTKFFQAQITWRNEKNRVIYMLLLIFYVALPACSAYTFRYFSCLKFDRGDGKSALQALAIDPTIRCTSKRYKRWFWYGSTMLV